MDTVIVVMLKDRKTGMLERELQTLNIQQNEDFLLNVFGIEENDEIFIHIKFTTNRDVLDWEFNAIYDYYDIEVFEKKGFVINDFEEEYNPTWEVVIPYDENLETLTETINNILALHRAELGDVLEVIKDKEGEYKDE